MVDDNILNALKMYDIKEMTMSFKKQFIETYCDGDYEKFYEAKEFIEKDIMQNNKKVGLDEV